MQRDEQGTLQLDKDKEAVKAYFIDYVNQNTVFFHNLREKLDYLVENNYYDKALLDDYAFDEIKAVFKTAYAKKFRFPSYMSAKKFYENYALKTNDKTKILERYEDRVSIVALYFGNGVAEKAIQFAELLINQEYQPATPTFLNVGKARRGEFVSCFLLECGDSLNDINMMNSTARQLSKKGGGISINLSKTRAKGESLMGYENVTSGVVPIMKNLDQSFRHINQAGQRNGSGSVYLNVMHADIFDFLDTKKITADEDVRIKTLSIGVVIPDKFIELARENKPAYLFYPHNLRQVTGKHLDEIDFDTEYDALINNPAIRKERIDPRNLLERIAIVQLESGYPYIMFEGNVNKTHALNNLGKVTFSNLCSEILQYSEVSEYTDYGEEDRIGQDISCNLGSLNIVSVMRNKSIESAVKLAMDALTKVSDDTNIANAPAVAKANREMHSVGLGAMNLHGFLAQNGIPYESDKAIEFADVFFSTVNYWTLVRSNEIARERGETFKGFEGSRYHTGEYFDEFIERPAVIKTDKIAELFKGIFVPSADDWRALKANVMKYGIYHSYRQAIAPTGSISYVQSSTASVMPIMERIEDRIYGDSKTYYPMPGLSPKTWFLYKEAYDMSMYKVIDLIATIQRHIDQGISFTLFVKDTTTTRELTRIQMYAHHKGIKTLYYVRQKDTGNGECVSCTI
ncbi:class 1b ribonucleoside-diphosphate reductase subunit alpha [Heyndrickxia oleronia]|uniref:Ribonucleoside-diphosphate reductase n=1 Tax=Heyndrickxia oleronia TaxID=38875 RepID=A0AAW6SNS1_9BACI|nr:class 1b ribonucleoside-diphosphate reductase subunit alpha [Heyndrickxia oleronia]MDH5159853.1 class 1b ribonucleoside-diphosphate reductase subunit alpha [Heyndrickxia oleronia]